MEEKDQIEALKHQALSSYGENREDAMDTLEVYGEAAIPALLEIADASDSVEHQKYARKKIRQIRGDSE
jgi:hypothetical protein